MTYDILCSLNVFLLNESGCEPLAYCSKGRSCHTLGKGGPWLSAGWELLTIIRNTNLTPTEYKE